MNPKIAAEKYAAAGQSEKRPAQYDLWQRYHRESDTGLENELIQQYLPLVKTVVGRLAITLPNHLDLDDLYSAGMIGLLHAIRNFDPRCKSSFETYARVRIRGAVLDELRRMDWVPRSVHEKARKVQEVMTLLEQKLGQTPTEAQMAKTLGVSLDEYLRTLDEIRPTAYICLDATTQGEHGETASLYEAVADEDQENPDDRASRRELAKLIGMKLKDLPEIQRKVLALYYEEDMLLREIAESFGLTESRICQIHAQAILAIKSHVENFESSAPRQLSSSKP